MQGIQESRSPQRVKPKAPIRIKLHVRLWSKEIFNSARTSLNYYSVSWSYGVTVSTLDSESSDRGSNPREAFTLSL